MQRADKRKYHVIYKITCLVNDKFYVGMHSTDNLEDGYMGSGKRIKYSINKYGLINHKFEILEFAESRKDLVKKEEDIINEQFLTNPLCMNIRLGGDGGFEHITSEQRSINAGKGGTAFSDRLKSDEEFANRISKNVSKKQKDLFENRDHNCNFRQSKSFLGKKHSIESIDKMKEAKRECIGEANSQFGTCWIFNEIEQKNLKIKLEDLEIWLSLGWAKGRKMK